MSSTILYKFRSGTTFEALPLPGTAARLFDVKKGIVKAKRLDVGGMDFELEVHDATTNQQYVDESMLLPRGTRLVVRRVGAARGQGFVNRMQRADAGGGMGAGVARTAAPTGFYTIESNHNDDDEFVSTNQRNDENELAALMAATETAQNPVGGMRPAGAGAAAGGGYNRPAGSGPPPPQSRPGGGNFSKQQNFRPNADPELRAHEQREAPKAKKATGIPRTFLNLSAPPPLDGLVQEGDGGPRLQANALGFEELVKRGGGQSGSNTGTRRDLDYALKLTATTIPEHLQCGICHNVVKSAMLLPWDLEGRTTCEPCIRDALAQSGFRCPLTGIEGVSPDDLFPNMALRKAAELFVSGVMEKMEEIVQQQVEEPDQEETALTSKEFEGETGEKGVIVSKKTMIDHRSKQDDDDPFGGGDDDFGGDVFAVEADEPEDPDTEESKEMKEATEKKATETAAGGGANPSEGTDKKQGDNADNKEKAAPAPVIVAPDPAIEEEKRREARRQRALPTGYVMGPAGGATGPPTPTNGDRQDDRGGRGRGGGRGWDRGGGGGYRESRGGRGGRGGRSYGGRGRDYDSGGGRGSYQGRDQARPSEERGSHQGRDQARPSEERGSNYEQGGGYDDDSRGQKRARSYSGEAPDEQRYSRDNRASRSNRDDREYRGGGADDWDGGGGGRGGYHDRGSSRYDDRRGDDRRGGGGGRGGRGNRGGGRSGGYGGRRGGDRGRGGYNGRGRY